MVQYISFWLLLAVTALTFWLLPQKRRLGFLGLVSFAYLLTFSPAGTLVLFLWLIAFYRLARRIRTNGGRRRWIAPILILGILGYLAWFKYVPRVVAILTGDAASAQIVLPLGISYFTFKLIHYAVEVGRGNIGRHHFGDFLCYIFLFPTFPAGPIERFDHLMQNREPTWRLDSMLEGLTRIIHGLIKRFVIQGILIVWLLGELGDIRVLIDRLDSVGPAQVWGVLILRYLSAYLDFSAAADIAIGASRLFGLRIMENFNFPIVARDIGDFWRRWHMTLAGWCQAYVYMPLIGLTRNPYLAVFVTFATIGLWHAGTLNWLCWGLYHGAGVATFTVWSRMKRRRGWTWIDKTWWRYAGWPLTFLFVSSSYAISSTHEEASTYAALRILAKLLFIDLPA
mgnify:CR=1 FL=1